MIKVVKQSEGGYEGLMKSAESEEDRLFGFLLAITLQQEHPEKVVGIY